MFGHRSAGRSPPPESRSSKGLRIKNWSHRSRTPRELLTGSPQTPLPVRVRHPTAPFASDPLEDGPETRSRQLRCDTPAPFAGSHSLSTETYLTSHWHGWRDRPNCQRDCAPRAREFPSGNRRRCRPERSPGLPGADRAGRSLHRLLAAAIASRRPSHR